MLGNKKEKLLPISVYKYYRLLQREDAIPVDVYSWSSKNLHGAIILGEFIYGWYNTIDKKLLRTVVRYGRVHKDSAYYSHVVNRSRIFL